MQIDCNVAYYLGSIDILFSAKYATLVKYTSWY